MNLTQCNDLLGFILQPNLQYYSTEPKFTELLGIDNDDEKQELSALVDGVLRALIEGVSDNPSKLWVMKQFCPALKLVEDSDTEVRDYFGEHMEEIMDILKIESSDQVLSFYLGYC